MPNHITNIVRASGTPEAITKYEEHMKTVSIDKEDGKEYTRYFDFSKLIHMPEDLSIAESSLGEMGEWKISGVSEISWLGNAELTSRWEKMTEENKKTALELGQKYIDNLKNYGHRTWYKWAIENWGTKWNGYSSYRMKRFSPSYDKKSEIVFNSAWSTPMPVWNKLQEMYPDIKFTIWYADEDTGSNCGIIKIHQGVMEVENREGNNRWARKVKNYDRWHKFDVFEV